MIDAPTLTDKDIGRLVAYTGGAGEKDCGRIKSWRGTTVFVVYDCNNEWNRWQDFTAQGTNAADLDFMEI